MQSSGRQLGRHHWMDFHVCIKDLDHVLGQGDQEKHGHTHTGYARLWACLEGDKESSFWTLIGVSVDRHWSHRGGGLLIQFLFPLPMLGKLKHDCRTVIGLSKRYIENVPVNHSRLVLPFHSCFLHTLQLERVWWREYRPLVHLNLEVAHLWQETQHNSVSTVS